MSTIPYTYLIDVPSGQHYKQVIELSDGKKEQVITIRAGRSACVSIVCTGTDVSGSIHIDIYAEHPDVHIKVGVACIIRGNNQCSITTSQHHVAPHTSSHLYVRKIMRDTSFAQYNGIIHIAKNAQGSVVGQDDKTLFDGIFARAESVPAIEVLTDDVVCTHGSALGRIDANYLWYMQTRGISQQEAAEMWYSAFLYEAQQAVFE